MSYSGNFLKLVPTETLKRVLGWKSRGMGNSYSYYVMKFYLFCAKMLPGYYAFFFGIRLSIGLERSYVPTIFANSQLQNVDLHSFIF